MNKEQQSTYPRIVPDGNKLRGNGDSPEGRKNQKNPPWGCRCVGSMRPAGDKKTRVTQETQRGHTHVQTPPTLYAIRTPAGPTGGILVAAEVGEDSPSPPLLLPAHLLEFGIASHRHLFPTHGEGKLGRRKRHRGRRRLAMPPKRRRPGRDTPATASSRASDWLSPAEAVSRSSPRGAQLLRDALGGREVAVAGD